MSTKSHPKRILIAVLSIGAAWLMPAAHAQQPAPGSVTLWNDQAKNGQWRAFGDGLEDTAPVADGQGLKLIVDWTASKWGVGAIYQGTPATTGVGSFPKVSSFHKIRFEVRSDSVDQTTCLIELASTAQEKDFRPAASFAKPVTKDWQTIEIELARAFPDLDQTRYPLDALRVLFLNSSKTGTNTLEFRNVALIP